MFPGPALEAVSGASLRTAPSRRPPSPSGLLCPKTSRWGRRAGCRGVQPGPITSHTHAHSPHRRRAPPHTVNGAPRLPSAPHASPSIPKPAFATGTCSWAALCSPGLWTSSPLCLPTPAHVEADKAGPRGGDTLEVLAGPYLQVPGDKAPLPCPQP